MSWQDELARDVRGVDQELRLVGVARVPSVCWSRPNGDLHEVHGVRFVGFREEFAGDDRPFLCWDPSGRRVVLAGGAIQRLATQGNRHGWIGQVPLLAWEGVSVFDQPLPEVAWDYESGVAVLRGLPEDLVAQVARLAIRRA